jgi:uncharacterized protein
MSWNLARRTGTILASDGTLRELADVLGRPKIACYVTAAEAQLFLEEILVTVDLVPIRERFSVSRDPADNKFLDLAAAGDADYLVTGDSDLLVLGSFRRTTILTPGSFLNREHQAPERS